MKVFAVFGVYFDDDYKHTQDVYHIQGVFTTSQHAYKHALISQIASINTDLEELYECYADSALDKLDKTLQNINDFNANISTAPFNYNMLLKEAHKITDMLFGECELFAEFITMLKIVQ
jgi:hypothetical protein